MSKKIAVFWPGDARDIPNQLALPNVQEATAQLERALKKLGRTPYQVPGFLAKPHHAIEKLSAIDDPLIGMCVHWLYGPHTCDGVVGKDNPLLLASNFSGRWPGLVGLLNTGACLESLNRPFSRAWTDARDFSSDETFMAQLDEWCTTGMIRYGTEEIRYHAPISAAASALALDVAAEIRARRVLILMLGDTSMGMINEVVSDRDVREVAIEYAEMLASGPRDAINWTKYSVNKIVKEFTHLLLDTSGALETLTFATPERREAVAAFAEKRKRFAEQKK